MHKLALKNLFYKRKRYKMMAIAIVAGFAILTVIDGISQGVLYTIQEKAARYFAGQINITGLKAGGVNLISNPDEIVDLIKEQKGVETVSKRTLYKFNDGTLFFNGETVAQRKITGIDFETEYRHMKKLSMDEGSIENMIGEDGKDGIMISRAAAKILGARVGDSVELVLYTDTYQHNSVSLIIRGVFNETSLFGYIAYVDIKTLNTMVGREPDSANEIAVFLERGLSYNEYAKKLYSVISEKRKCFEPFLDRENRDNTLAQGITEESLMIMTLDSQLSQITDILEAVTLISYFVIVVFILIVMAGILNTYRVMVYERTKEIGTMRALGTKKRIILGMFMEEAAFLAIISIILGFVCALFILIIVTNIDFSSFSIAGMVTDGGHLAYYINPVHLLLNSLLMLFAVILAAFQPAKKAAFISPAEAMRNIN